MPLDTTSLDDTLRWIETQPEATHQPDDWPRDPVAPFYLVAIIQRLRAELAAPQQGTA